MGRKWIVDTLTGKTNKASGVCFLSLPCGRVVAIDPAIEGVGSWPNIYCFNTSLKVGVTVGLITSSLNRYGSFIVQGENRDVVDYYMNDYSERLNRLITIE